MSCSSLSHLTRRHLWVACCLLALGLGAVELRAAECRPGQQCETGSIPDHALWGGLWSVIPGQITITDAQEGSGDEPMIFFFGFRSRIGRPGSTQVWGDRNVFPIDVDLPTGAVRSLGGVYGTHWSDVKPLLNSSSGDGDIDVYGAVVVAIEEDGCPDSAVRDTLGDIQEDLRQSLADILEPADLGDALDPAFAENLERVRDDLLAATDSGFWGDVAEFFGCLTDPDDAVGGAAAIFVAPWNAETGAIDLPWIEDPATSTFVLDPNRPVLPLSFHLENADESMTWDVTAELRYTLEVPGEPTRGIERQPIAGDVNGDGLDDLIFLGHGWGGPSLNINTRFSIGDGRWRGVRATKNWGPEVLTYLPLAGDLDADCQVDLVFFGDSWAGAGLNLRTLRSEGNGTFASAEQVLGDGPGVLTNRPLLGDVDGDGDDDVIFYGQGWSGAGLNVRVKLSNGDGTFTAAPEAVIGWGPEAHTFAPVVIDANGDDRDDLAFLWEQAPGTLHVRTLLAVPGQPGVWTQIVASHPLSTLHGIDKVAGGDLDGDGDGDLVFSYRSGAAPGGGLNLKVQKLRSRGDGTFFFVVGIDDRTGWGLQFPYYELAVEDSDNDGADEVVAVRTDVAGVHILTLNDQTLSSFFVWAAPQSDVLPGVFLHTPVAGDFDGDGRGDRIFLHPMIEIGVAEVFPDRLITLKGPLWRAVGNGSWEPLTAAYPGAGLSASCDPDDDGDGHLDGQDNCPAIHNPGQQDNDADGTGDVCDGCPLDPSNDVDRDTICGQIDNCPDVPNREQTDSDGDGPGDACDSNDDNDQWKDVEDNCRLVANDDQRDGDGDGVGDACDNCLGTPNPDQSNSDDDPDGDACDDDDDNDGVLDGDDNCQWRWNPDQSDLDGDGRGDACDPDGLKEWTRLILDVRFAAMAEELARLGLDGPWGPWEELDKCPRGCEGPIEEIFETDRARARGYLEEIFGGGEVFKEYDVVAVLTMDGRFSKETAEGYLDDRFGS